MNRDDLVLRKLKKPLLSENTCKVSFEPGMTSLIDAPTIDSCRESVILPCTPIIFWAKEYMLQLKIKNNNMAGNFRFIYIFSMQ